MTYFFRMAGWFNMMYKLPKQRILRKNKQFQCIYRLGKSYANRYMVLYVMTVKETQTKVGFAAGKRLGNAVVRNRVKRLLRETYRMNQHRLKPGLQLLCVGRKPVIAEKYEVVNKAFEDLCRKAHIFGQ